MKCVFSFSLQPLSETFLTLRMIQQGTTINLHKSSYTVPVIVVIFQSNFNFLTHL
jgi:hypothetical protein